MPSRHTTVGPERAPHRSYLYAMGLNEKTDRPARSSAWRPAGTRAAPCNIALSRQAQAVKVGVDRGGGTPREFTTITVTDGIAMGHQGYEVLARQPRPHRRLRRTHHAGPLLRRHGDPGRLRQVAARHDDGHAAAQRAVGLHVWRLDPARQVPRQGCHRGRRVRGRRHACRRQVHRCRPARARMRGLSVGWARVAASSPPTPWPASPRRSGWRYLARPAHRRPTRRATSTPRRRARRR